MKEIGILTPIRSIMGRPLIIVSSEYLFRYVTYITLNASKAKMSERVVRAFLWLRLE